MSTTAPARPRSTVRQYSTPEPTSYGGEEGTGWVLFAAVMLSLIATLNFIDGIAAVSNSKFYVANAEFVFSNLNTWGWILIVAGVVQVVVAFAVWAATEWGRWLGVIAAGLNMIVQFFALPSFPARSILMFFVDVIVIYGLLTYGGRNRYSLADSR